MTKTLISVLDFIQTYEHETYPDYGLAYLDLHKQLKTLLDDETYPRIEPSLNEACEKTLRNYLTQSTSPKSVTGIKKLNSLGITFPILYTDRIAEPLFTFYALGLFSGKLGGNFAPSFHIRPELSKTIQKRIRPFRLQQRKGKRENIYFVHPYGTALGRLLFCMGIPTNFEDNPTLSPLEYLISQNDYPHLKDAVLNQFIQNKAKFFRSYLTLRLPATKDYSFGTHFNTIMETLFKQCFPEITLREEMTRRPSGNSVMYTPTTHINGHSFAHMMQGKDLSIETKAYLILKSGATSI